MIGRADLRDADAVKLHTWIARSHCDLADAARAAYCGMADFLEEFVQQGMPLDDMIIGTLNTIDPLLDPAGICDQECIRYLKGITPEDIARIRREILDTTNQELGGLVGVIREYIETGKFCAVGDVK